MADRIGKNFLTELLAKEQVTGLKLYVTGVSWGDPHYITTGLDPLPAGLTPAQITAINEVVAAHDPTKPDKVAANAGIQAQIDALEKSQGRALREAALGMIGAGARLATIETNIVTLRAQRIP